MGVCVRALLAYAGPTLFYRLAVYPACNPTIETLIASVLCSTCAVRFVSKVLNFDDEARSTRYVVQGRHVVLELFWERNDFEILVGLNGANFPNRMKMFRNITYGVLDVENLITAGEIHAESFLLLLLRSGSEEMFIFS